MEPTSAVIQFIGIILFSASIPNDPGVHAILPRIGHVHQIQAPGSPPSSEQESFVDGVEDHVAVIMYRREDRLSLVGGWRADGMLQNGWEYVRLDGEHVQFLSNGKNGTPQIPASLPRAGGAPSCNNVRPPALRPEFQAPYRGAIGVFDLRAGRMDACETDTVRVDQRVDTRFIVDTEGVLVIAATKPGTRAKFIALDEDAVVYVANVPPDFVLWGFEPARVGEPHWAAYNDMLDTSCAAKPERPDIVLEACDLSKLSEAYVQSRRYPPIKFRLINSECSNAQNP